MKRTLITIALTTIVVLVLVGLATSALFSSGASVAPTSLLRDAGGYGGGAPDTYAAPPMEMPAAAPLPADMSIDKSSDTFNNTAPVVADDVERKVIKNASLTVVVADPVKSMDEISKMAEQMGGYVVSLNAYQTDGPNNVTVPEGNISIRVPAEKLDEALTLIKENSVEVRSASVSGQDVTDQYVDLQSRLSAKLATEKKLLEFLEQAETTEDALAVYAQLQIIESDIEVLKGQIKYIDQSAALSSISVTLIAEAGTQPIEIGGWELKGTANEAVQDLIQFTQNFTQSLIRLFLYILPALVLLAIPVYLIFLGGRAVYRRVRKPKAVVEVEAKEEEKK